MSLLEAAAIVLAGIAAGTINTIVGSGTLVTFPTLLFFGMPPVAANVSNNLGLVPGSFTAAFGYRAEMRGARGDLRRLVPASFVGGVLGAVLLLVLDPGWFKAIVPVLIALGLVLVIFGRQMNAWAARHHGEEPATRWGLLRSATGLAGAYGGYFGAAQGVLLIGLLGSALPETLQRVNGLKNLLSALVNTVAAVTFLVVRPEAADWTVIALIAVGSLVGGVLGARIGRWLPQPVLRAVIIVVGVVAIVRLVNGG